MVCTDFLMPCLSGWRVRLLAHLLASLCLEDLVFRCHGMCGGPSVGVPLGADRAGRADRAGGRAAAGLGRGPHRLRHGHQRVPGGCGHPGQERHQGHRGRHEVPRPAPPCPALPCPCASGLAGRPPAAGCPVCLSVCCAGRPGLRAACQAPGHGWLRQQRRRGARAPALTRLHLCACRFCKPLDGKLLRQMAANHPVIITVEEGSIGGFGSHGLAPLLCGTCCTRIARLQRLWLLQQPVGLLSCTQVWGWAPAAADVLTAAVYPGRGMDDSGQATALRAGTLCG